MPSKEFTSPRCQYGGISSMAVQQNLAAGIYGIDVIAANDTDYHTPHNSNFIWSGIGNPTSTLLEAQISGLMLFDIGGDSAFSGNVSIAPGLVLWLPFDGVKIITADVQALLYRSKFSKAVDVGALLGDTHNW